MAKSSSKTGAGKTAAGAKTAGKAAPAKETKTKTAAAKAATSKATASKPAAAKAPAKAAKPAAKPAKPAGKSAAPRGGLAQPVTPSKELAKIVGANPLPRSEIVKKIWDYIKAHGLQDAKNKREINADATLEPIFGKKKVTMFEMNSHIARNVK
ncbi:MAG: SWIB/MDM2 domain-containing protein [Alsobacter sp.]